MLSAYQPLAEHYRPYLVATATLADGLPYEALGLRFAPADRFNPLLPASAPFLNLLQRLDALTFGPLGMEMPRWAFYDCAELPGAIVGLGADVAALGAQALSAMQVPEGYQGIVPLSMYIAIPMLQPRRWLGYSICTLDEVSPGAIPPGMGELTVALALSLLDVRSVVATTQWASPKLQVHAHFAPLRLLASYIPRHDQPRSCVFELEVSAECLARALADEPVPARHDLTVDAFDDQALEALQREIEAGARVDIVGPPSQRGSRLELPLVRAGHP